MVKSKGMLFASLILSTFIASSAQASDYQFKFGFYKKQHSYYAPEVVFRPVEQFSTLYVTPQTQPVMRVAKKRRASQQHAVYHPAYYAPYGYNNYYGNYYYGY